MSIPAFFFDENKINLGYTVNCSTLESSYGNVPAKTSVFELKKKSCFLNGFNYSLGIVNPQTVVEDLSRLFKVPKSCVFQLYNGQKMKNLLVHFDNKPAILVNFCLSDKVKTSISKSKKSEIYINRIDYGVQFFAVVQPLTGLETDEKFKMQVNESLIALLKNGRTNYVHGSCVLIFSDNYYPIDSFSKLFDIVNLMMKKSAKPVPVAVYLVNNELNLKDDRNFDQLLKDMSICVEYAAYLSQRISYSGGGQNIIKIDFIAMNKLKKEIDNTFEYPLNQLQIVMDFVQVVEAHLKKSNDKIFEIVAVLKDLLNTAVEATKRFVNCNGHWFLISSVDILRNAPPGFRFYISNRNYSSEFYDVFQSSGWIFVKFDAPSDPDDLFFITGDSQSRSFGMLHSTNKESLYPSSSSRLFSMPCPCGVTQRNNYWICDECKSFVYYHQRRTQYVSCKCGSFEMTSLQLNSYDTVCYAHGYKTYVPFVTAVTKDYSDCYNVLIMGQSGVGKSTLVNGIANYLKYETLHEAETDRDVTCVIPCQFEVQDDNYENHTVMIGDAKPSEENFNNQGHSVTQKPQDYYFETPSNDYIHVIDTPGLADSRGVEQDDINLRLIREAIVDVGRLHALCFVLKPNESKLSNELETTIRRLLSIFPKDALKSVVFCFTNSRGSFYKPGDSRGPINKLIEELQKECGASFAFAKQNVFCTDNEGFRYLCAQNRGIKYTSATYKDYEDSWRQSRKSTLALIDRIKDVQPFDTRTINFYTELAAVTRKWADWIKDRQISSDQIKRFATIADQLEKNLIGTDAKYFIQLAETKNGKCKYYVSDLKGIMDILHQEFVDISVDFVLANEMRSFLDRYIFQL